MAHLNPGLYLCIWNRFRYNMYLEGTWDWFVHSLLVSPTDVLSQVLQSIHLLVWNLPVLCPSLHVPVYGVVWRAEQWYWMALKLVHFSVRRLASIEDQSSHCLSSLPTMALPQQWLYGTIPVLAAHIMSVYQWIKYITGLPLDKLFRFTFMHKPPHMLRVDKLYVLL